MKVLATYPVGKDPDVLAFDTGLKQLYVSAESGDVTVSRENGKALVTVGSFSMPHAHAVWVDLDPGAYVQRRSVNKSNIGKEP
jgi:hypothetical protein